MGGFTMYILLLCSIISIGVILERIRTYYLKSRLDRKAFMSRIKSSVENGDYERAIKECDRQDSPIAGIVLAGLKNYKHEEKVYTSAMEREIMVETVKLERYTSIVGTIGNIAVMRSAKMY